MKALICGLCTDIRALSSRGGPEAKVTCRCGNASAWWEDPLRGTVKVSAQDRAWVRLLGLHNQFLQAAFDARLTHGGWKSLHQTITEKAEGYLFHDSLRGCPFAIIRVGESSDASWADEEPQGTAPVLGDGQPGVLGVPAQRVIDLLLKLKHVGYEAADALIDREIQLIQGVSSEPE